MSTENPNDSYPFPISGVDLDSKNSVKLNEDTYEVYVNDELVGHKTLKSAGEKLSDIEDFLSHQGINDFSSAVRGDHYLIHTSGDFEHLKNALSVYFENR
ncbi:MULTISPECIES: hypothetical protein [Bacillaceae]|uniref:hypothetical protein n=1 Tax=Bacillaceae TaxID=186817 RepID=UPI000BF7EA6C|nr:MULTISPECIES: hypothetical protein [unclassified Bacillus (in: firmicutes)]PET52314.1 hypothetical protein CN514_19125 [Bacillus sp. AFS001701]PFH91379.1 hypothetical protein COI44_01885 [Bacillus sp. AFS088145]PGZ89902.1 hypothetical protein COE53_18685 [Bacillus sp. AFS029533]